MPVIRIRGMPFYAKKSDVVDFFSGISILNDEKGIHFIQRHPVKPSGEAYVEIKDENEEKEALKKHKEYMFDRYIEVFTSTQEELDRYLGRGMRNERDRPPLYETVIRIRGLPWDINKAELTTYFWDVELVPNGLALIMDHSGYCTGEGYMRIFPSRQNVERALSKDGIMLGRRPLEVRESTMEEADYHIKFQIDRNRMLKRPGPPSYGSYGGYQPYPPTPSGYPGGGPPPAKYRGGPRDRSPISRGDMGLGYPPRKSTGYCIYMRGLPFDANLKDVEDFYYPTRVLDVRFSKGDAFAEFASYEDVEEAMKKDRNKIGHRYIELFMRCEDGPNSDSRSNGYSGKSVKQDPDSRNQRPAPVPPPSQSMSYYAQGDY